MNNGDIKIIDNPIKLSELSAMAVECFGDFVKAVVDIRRCIMALGGELHADEERVLLENGSKQEDLWGINIFPNKERSLWIEFDSMINIRPRQGNRSRGVEDEQIREGIRKLVDKLITD